MARDVFFAEAEAELQYNWDSISQQIGWNEFETHVEKRLTVS